MLIDINSIQILINYLHSKNINNDEQLKFDNSHLEFMRNEMICIHELINEAHKSISFDKAVLFFGNPTKAAEQTKKFVSSINEILKQLSSYIATLQWLFLNHDSSFNSSIAHAYLVTLALYNMDNLPSTIEIIQLQERGETQLSALVVVNRQKDSDLYCSATWGDECLVIDSFNNRFGYLTESDNHFIKSLQIPYSQFSLILQLDTNLHTLSTFNDTNHHLHKFELKTRECLLNHLKIRLSELNLIFSLPMLQTELLIPDNLNEERISSFT